MSDECDIANDRADAEREYRISEARRQVSGPTYFTHCQWCGDPTEMGGKYCSVDCRDDHQDHMAAGIRNGL